MSANMKEIAWLAVSINSEESKRNESKRNPWDDEGDRQRVKRTCTMFNKKSLENKRAQLWKSTTDLNFNREWDARTQVDQDAKAAAIKHHKRKIEEDRALVGDMLGLKYLAGEFYYTIEPEQSKSTDEWVQANNI
jgi:hypothetical protein